MAMIEARGLKKNYGKHVGTRDVTFSVNEGEMFGFIGPNGAGKSTTIKILLGFIFAGGGSASIRGQDVARDTKEIKRFTGYVPSDVRLYGNMTVFELLERNGRFYEKDGHGDEARRLCELLELDPSKRFGELSTGNKKKAAIVCAMAPKPKVILLDEPTNGLDPMAQKRLFTELKAQTARGCTVLLSSHNLAEVQEYCDRAAFIKGGTILAVRNLKEAHAQKIVTVFGGNQGMVEGMDVLIREGSKCAFRYGGDGAALLALLKGLEPDDFTVENESVEEQFMRMYGEEAAK